MAPNWWDNNLGLPGLVNNYPTGGATEKLVLDAGGYECLYNPENGATITCREKGYAEDFAVSFADLTDGFGDSVPPYAPVKFGRPPDFAAVAFFAGAQDLMWFEPRPCNEAVPGGLNRKICQSGRHGEPGVFDEVKLNGQYVPTVHYIDLFNGDANWTFDDGTTAQQRYGKYLLPPARTWNGPPSPSLLPISDAENPHGGTYDQRNLLWTWDDFLTMTDATLAWQTPFAGGRISQGCSLSVRPLWITEEPPEELGTMLLGPYVNGLRRVKRVY